MNAQVKLRGEVAVVKVKGKLMGGPETYECHSRMKQLISEGCTKAAIDLSDVEWVNSSGLGMLIACYTSFRNANGDLKLACASEKTKDLLAITKLDGVFESYNTIDEAVQSY